MTTVLRGCPNGKHHLSRVHKKLHHIVLAKLPNTVGTELDLFILKGHIWAAVRVKKLRTSNLKAAHIKVAGLHSNMDFRLRFYKSPGIVFTIGGTQAGSSLEVVRRLESCPAWIDRDIASQKAAVNDTQLGENGLVPVLCIVQQVLNRYVVIP